MLALNYLCPIRPESKSACTSALRQTYPQIQQEGDLTLTL